jgi:diguanylate cyclase (GGDEF)-like protein
MDLIRRARHSSWINPQPEMLDLTSAPRYAMMLVVWMQIALVTFAAAFCVSTFIREPGYSFFWDGFLYTSVGVLAAALAIAKAKLCSDKDRWAWRMFAMALILNASGSLWALGERILMDDPPYAGPADIGFFGFYPFMYISIVLLMRGRITKLPRSVWLDGAIGALACGGVALAIEYNSIISGVGTGTPLESGLDLAYPVADVLILAMIAGCFSLSSWRPDRVWMFVAGGLLTLAISDGGAMVMAEQLGDYLPGTPLDIPWTVGWAFLGLAPWRRSLRVEDHASSRWSIVVLPLLFSVASVAVLAIASFHEFAPIVVILSTTALLGGLLRLGLTFNELRTLNRSKKEARTDELTELGNRRYFYEQARALMVRRPTTQPLALLVIDLDRFKEINDSLGHQIGDGLLRQLGPRLRTALDESAIIARLGGDEFAVILNDADINDAKTVSAAVIAAMEEPFVLDGVPVRVSASVGIALFPDHAREPNGLLQHADVAMYSAKRERSGLEIYSPERDLHTKERLRSIHELRRSIEQGRLVVHYQPQVDAETRQLTGVEALVRLQHPTRGIVPPDLFLPLAEQAGLMRLLTDNVLKLVLDDLVVWRDAGCVPVKVAVNLSMTNLLDVHFPAQLKEMLKERHLNGHSLVFEVTESTMLSDVNRAVEQAQALRELGCELSVDDYGTGYASLAYLRRLPLDELKLDKSFITDMHTDPTSLTFVRSTIDVAHSLRIRVVAEGIETNEMWQTMRSLGTDVCQGYYFGKPMPGNEFLEKLQLLTNSQAHHADPLIPRPV